MLFNEARMKEINSDLEIAKKGDQVARDRVIRVHLPWLLKMIEGAVRRLEAEKPCDEGIEEALREEIVGLENMLAEYQQLPEEE